MSFWNFLFNKEKVWPVPEHLKNHDPTKPIPFGIKCLWLAIKTEDHEKVCEVLGLQNAKAVDWIEGMVRSREDDLFVMPPIDGWTLVKGDILPSPDVYQSKIEDMLKNLSRQFGEAYMFGNHRVVSMAFWFKSLAGEMKRGYLFGDGPGYQYGEESATEKEWNLLDPNISDHADEAYFDSHLMPGEEEVLQLAEIWTVNPLKIDKKTPLYNYGFVGQVK